VHAEAGAVRGTAAGDVRGDALAPHPVAVDLEVIGSVCATAVLAYQSDS
jgi:hypothetical protein